MDKKRVADLVAQQIQKAYGVDVHVYDLDGDFVVVVGGEPAEGVLPAIVRGVKVRKCGK
jgi:hypothetical protein